MSTIPALTANKKRHTKPCVYFQTSQCPLDADECDFVHVYDEEAAAGADALRSKYRTKPCRYYLAGSCSQGVWCRFKHPIGDYPRTPVGDIEPLSENENLDDEYSALPDVRDVDTKWKRQRELHPKYKTRPCRDWLLGNCRRGDSCSYLHPPQSASTHPTQASTLASVTQPYNGVPGYPPGQYVYYPSIHPGASYDAYTTADEPESATTTGESDSSSVSPSTPSEPLSALDDGPWDHQSSAKPTLPAMIPSGMPLASPQYTLQHQPFFHVHQQSPAQPTMVVHVPLQIPLPPAYIPYYPSSAEATTKGRQRSLSQPPAHRRKAPAYKTKPCKFYNTPAGCPKGLSCNFAHELLPASMHPSGAVASAYDETDPDVTPTLAAAAPSEVPAPSRGKAEEQRNRDYYPITWRVIGGGVMMAGSNTTKAPRTTISRENSSSSTDYMVPSVGAARDRRHELSIAIPAPPTTARSDSFDFADIAAASRAKSTPSSPTSTQPSLYKLFAEL